ncbi:MAG TPA: hypothetical protein VFP22_05305 [Candidatus Limnocylindrales bacterium]|nr:hypothetical protein [Candidatus Limnocylindrales bacterium]
MRSSNQIAHRRRRRGTAGPLIAVVVTLVVVACGSSAAPSPSPTLVPTPVITPDPHLTDPVTADRIFVAFSAAKTGITANNANSETGDPAVVKVINADIANWPLRITQFTSASALARSVTWKPGTTPGADQAPYNIVGLNILIQFGPISGRPPSMPDASRQAAAAQIVAILDPLLWPLSQHSVVIVPSRTPEPTATPSVSVAPSKPPKTPKPSASHK